MGVDTDTMLCWLTSRKKACVGFSCSRRLEGEREKLGFFSVTCWMLISLRRVAGNGSPGEPVFSWAQFTCKPPCFLSKHIFQKAFLKPAATSVWSEQPPAIFLSPHPPSFKQIYCSNLSLCFFLPSFHELRLQPVMERITYIYSSTLQKYNFEVCVLYLTCFIFWNVKLVFLYISEANNAHFTTNKKLEPAVSHLKNEDDEWFSVDRLIDLSTHRCRFCHQLDSKLQQTIFLYKLKNKIFLSDKIKKQSSWDEVEIFMIIMEDKILHYSFHCQW